MSNNQWPVAGTDLDFLNQDEPTYQRGGGICYFYNAERTKGPKLNPMCTCRDREKGWLKNEEIRVGRIWQNASKKVSKRKCLRCDLQSVKACNFMKWSR